MLQSIKCSTVILTLFFFSSSYAQQANLDSLKQVLNRNVHDTLKLDAAGTIMVNVPNDSKEYDYYNEKAKKIAEQLLKNKNLDKASRSRANVAIGTYYVNKAYQYMKSDYVMSIKYLDKSLEYFNGSSKKTRGTRAILLVNAGIMYSKIGNTKIAINYFFEALRYLESIKANSDAAFATQNIANLYKDQKKYNEALKYYLKTYSLYFKEPKLDFQESIQKVFLFIKISNCYQELYQCQQAESYLNKAFVLAKDLNDLETLAEVYFELGVNEDKCKTSNLSALQQFQKSYNSSKQPEIHAKSLIAMGKIFLKQKHYTKAESSLLKGLALGKQISNLSFQKEATDNLVLLYKQKRQFDDAFKMKELNSELKDSIRSEQNNTMLLRKQLEYEYDNKEKINKLTQEQRLKTIKLQTQKEKAVKNYWLIALSGVLLLLLLGLYFYYKNNKQKQAIAVLEKNQIKQKLLISQMNPHFIFNSIQNVRSLIHNKQEAEAINYINKFSAITRQILKSSDESYITMSEELEQIENYLALQQLSYPDTFTYTITVDDEIDTDAILLPPMLSQPFIENAIKHGLRHEEKNGKLTIRFYMKNESLFFEVIDNGSGFGTSKKIDNHKSMAMEITRNRLAHYTKNQDFMVHSDNLIDADQNIIGAKINFEIPYIYEK